MSYCINPNCNQRQNPDDAEVCLSCGTSLLINERIRLIEPLRVLPEDPFGCFTEIFEIDDVGSEWHIKDEWQRQRIMKVLTWNRPELLSLFEREAQALRRIHHPNIPRSTIDDYFTFVPTTCPKLYCLVMQRFEGQNLAQWISTYGRISQSQALQWLRQLFEILDFVHHAGYFHRDIKPSNIIVQPNGQLALIDFGGVREVTDTYLAKISGGGKTDTGWGYEITAIRTPRYSPLEQINGQAVPQSDFYAVGRTFVYCVSGIQLGELPTDGKTGRLIWRNKAPQIDQPLADFLDELMAPFPSQRPQTTQIVLQRLERLPLKSKLNRVVKSKPFIISAAILVLLSAFGLYNASTYLVSSFYFNQASRNKDRPEAAKKDYELAIKFNPQDVYAYNNLAVLCQQLRDYKCVTRSYELLFQKKPNMWEAHDGLGNFYDQQGKFDLAQQQYEAARKSNKQAVQPISNLSRLNNIKGDYKTAIDLATEGLQLTKKPEFQAALFKNLGWALFEQKQYAEAKKYLQKATKLDSERTDAYCLLAQAQEALGEINDSKVSWEVCLVANANSNLPEVQAWRQQVLQRLWNQQNKKNSYGE